MLDNLTTASGEERSGAELEAESTASAESVAGGSASHHSAQGAPPSNPGKCGNLAGVASSRVISPWALRRISRGARSSSFSNPCRSEWKRIGLPLRSWRQYGQRAFFLISIKKFVIRIVCVPPHPRFDASRSFSGFSMMQGSFACLHVEVYHVRGEPATV